TTTSHAAHGWLCSGGPSPGASRSIMTSGITSSPGHRNRIVSLGVVLNVRPSPARVIRGVSMLVFLPSAIAAERNCTVQFYGVKWNGDRDRPAVALSGDGARVVHRARLPRGHDG